VSLLRISKKSRRRGWSARFTSFSRTFDETWCRPKA